MKSVYQRLIQRGTRRSLRRTRKWML